MSRQRQRMLQDLVLRARAVGDHLGTEVPSLAAGGSDDEAAYSFFFEQFLAELEEDAKDFNERVVEDSRNLLVLATCRIFANLARLEPSLDLEAGTAPVDLNSRAVLSDRTRKAAEEYAKIFDQVEVEEGEADGEEDAGEEEKRAAAGDEGTSGGPTA